MSEIKKDQLTQPISELEKELVAKIPLDNDNMEDNFRLLEQLTNQKNNTEQIFSYPDCNTGG